MIRSFRHKGLAALYQDDNPRGMRPDLVERCRARLTVLQTALDITDLQVPGLRFHTLQGKPKRYAIAVNGPWRITFEWQEAEAWRVDLEQYH
ncbi:MAG: type II toxin-antitoxin system RelE/ParE family toxin [Gammaproteobacteria bacterium]